MNAQASNITPLPEVSPGVKRVLVRGVPMFRVVIPKAISPTGQRQRKFFAELKDATALVRSMDRQASSGAKSIATLSTGDAARLSRLIERAGSIEKLEAAIELRGDVQETTRKTVEALIDEIAAVKSASGKRRIYVLKMTAVHRRFGAVFGRKVVSTVTGQQIEDWLYGNNWAPSTRLGYLSDIRTLFTFAVRRGYATKNPVADVEAPTTDEKPPGILSVADCVALVTACATHDRKLLPYLGLCLFAGVRPTETRRISWADVRDGFVVINASSSKTRSQRLIEITPTLERFLIKDGDLPARNIVKRMNAIRDRAMLESWPRDGMRHSFVTYAMPTKGAVWTVEQAGHSLQVSLKHYRALASKAESEAFWNIQPNLL